ncbi:MAG: hypothetical protein HQ594_03390 [Candidatus Omnitrophica bacterium]|nr:hypothetical protein [Candidatus Omnitrophota bacterium]
MKKNILIFIIGFSLAIVLVTHKDKAIKFCLEKTGWFVFGVKMDIGKVDVEILNSAIDLKDIILYNPEGFSPPVMAEISRFYIDFDLSSIFLGKIYLYELKFYLKNLNMIRNKDGLVNVDSLKTMKHEKGVEKKPTEAQSKMPEITIDLLHLKGKEFAYWDYSPEAKQLVKRYDINLDEVHKDVTDPFSLIGLILDQVWNKMVFEDVINLPRYEASKIAGGAYSAGKRVVFEPTREFFKVTKEVFASSTNAVKKKRDDIRKSAGGWFNEAKEGVLVQWERLAARDEAR